MARYRLKSPHFFAPDFYPANTVMDFEGALTPEMEPLDEDAEKAMDAYFAANPHASIRPVEKLSLTMAPQIVVIPEAPKVPKVVTK